MTTPPYVLRPSNRSWSCTNAIPVCFVSVLVGICAHQSGVCRAGYVDGPALATAIVASYDHQLRQRTSTPRVFSVSKKAPPVALFAPLYVKCMGGSVANRNAFLQKLLGEFKRQRMLGHRKGHRPAAGARLDMGKLRYCAEVLSSLPYEKEEGVLFVIHTINRLVSLGSSCVALCGAWCRVGV